MGRGSDGLPSKKKAELKAGGCLAEIIMLPFTLVFEILKAIFGKKGRRR